MSRLWRCRTVRGICTRSRFTPGACCRGQSSSNLQRIRRMLTTDSKARKDTPIYSGVRRYFPLALAAISRVSKKGNDKHNPGQPLHWAREKSGDHLDCVDRHLTDNACDPDGIDP